MELHDLLTAATVRIRRNGAEAGTGFLVTPRDVITCAHVVVGEPVPEITVELFGDRSKPPVEVPVTAMEVQPTTAPSGGLHPLPDVAHLTIDPTELSTYCVRLTADRPAQRDDLYAFGFPKGLDGDSRGFVHEGAAYFPGAPSTKLITLGSNIFPEGFSGAPVLDETQASVCAMIKARRGQDEGFGGWAVPLRVLLDGLTDKDLLSANRIHHEIHPAWDSAAGPATEVSNADPPAVEGIGRTVRTSDRGGFSRLVERVRSLLAPPAAGVIVLPADSSVRLDEPGEPVGPRLDRALRTIVVQGAERDLAVLEMAAVLRVGFGHDVVVLASSETVRTADVEVTTAALIAAGVPEQAIPLTQTGVADMWQRLVSARRLVLAVEGGERSAWDAVLIPQLAERGSIVVTSTPRTMSRLGPGVTIAEESLELGDPVSARTVNTFDDTDDHDGAVPPPQGSGTLSLLLGLEPVGTDTAVSMSASAVALARQLAAAPYTPVSAGDLVGGAPSPVDIDELASQGVLQADGDLLTLHPDVRRALRSSRPLRIDVAAQRPLASVRAAAAGGSYSGLLAALASMIGDDGRQASSPALGGPDSDPPVTVTRELRIEARRLRDAGRAPSALAVLNAAADLPDVGLGRGRTWIQIGHLFSRRRHLDEATRAFAQARLALPDGAHLERARLLRHEAAVQRKSSHEEQGLELVRRAWQELVGAENPGNAARAEMLNILNEQLVLFRRLDRVPETLATIELASAYADLEADGPLRRSTANHLRHRGRTWIRVDDPARAVEDLDAALRLAPANSDVTFTARRDLVTAHLALGNLGGAFQFAREAAVIADDRGMPAGIADAREAQGRTALAIGDLSAAEECFREALTKYRAISGKVGEAGALAGLARAALRRGNQALADDYTRAAELVPAGSEGMERVAVLRLKLALAANSRDEDALERIRAIETEARSRQLLVVVGACERERGRLQLQAGDARGAAELVSRALVTLNGRNYEEEVATLWLGAAAELSAGNTDGAAEALALARARVTPAVEALAPAEAALHTQRFGAIAAVTSLLGSDSGSSQQLFTLGPVVE